MNSPLLIIEFIFTFSMNIFAVRTVLAVFAELVVQQASGNFLQNNWEYIYTCIFKHIYMVLYIQAHKQAKRGESFFLSLLFCFEHTQHSFE